MRLDQFVPPVSDESEKSDNQSGLGELFGRSALYELHQAAFGLAQSFGLQDRIGDMAQPAEAESWWGQQAQIIGRGFGSFLPTMAVAVATRHGLGSRLERSGIAAENLLVKRSALGLSLGESAVTGLVSGSLLKPSDDSAAHDWGSFVADRAQGRFIWRVIV